MDMITRACVPHLVELGFSEIESAAYAWLVQNSPATAYRVAHGIHKPVANTYKAISSLRDKGAVMVDRRAGQRCRAVPPSELLALLEERRRGRLREAECALANLHPAEGDEGVYTLGSRAHAVERFRDMLARARGVALADIFPEPLSRMRHGLEAAAARGVRVALLVYEPVAIRGAEVILHSRADSIRARWPGQWMNLVVDGSESLHVFLGEADVQAVWSRSAYLSWIAHGGLWGEMLAHRLGAALDAGASVTTLKRLRARLDRVLRPDLEGYHRLTSRLTKRSGREPVPARSRPAP